ncbi:hypothetical protein LJC47_02920 [Desulfosarcina sp. OttesenSCG-928-B08]|nr:hypothetical protein [Desulfosarcina sp. OttesenSCG-928-B08]
MTTGTDTGISTQLRVLEKLMEIYDEFIGTHTLSCKKHCAHCCTANVTLTTLEGWRMVAHLEKAGLFDSLPTLFENARPDRFVPRISINAMADICARDGDLPEEPFNPDAGPCLLLDLDVCPVYAARPFGCRCMVSSEHCAETGAAALDPFILTVNNVFLQYIEHIDAKGGTGNLIDVIRFLSDPENRRHYEAGRLDAFGSVMVPNQPVFVLMVPPEHREQIAPLMDRIRSIRL